MGVSISEVQRKKEDRAHRALSPLARYAVDINQRSTEKAKITRAIVHNAAGLVNWFCVHRNVGGSFIYSDIPRNGAFAISLAFDDIKRWETTLLLLSVTGDMSAIVNSRYDVPHESPLNSVLKNIAWVLEDFHGYAIHKEKAIYLLKALLLKGVDLDEEYPSLAGYNASGYLERFLIKDNPDRLAAARQIMAEAKTAVTGGNFRLEAVNIPMITPDSLPLTPEDRQGMAEYQRIVSSRTWRRSSRPTTIMGIRGLFPVVGDVQQPTRLLSDGVGGAAADIDDRMDQTKHESILESAGYSDSDIPEEYRCSLSHQVMDTPVYDPGHEQIRYEKKIILQWLNRQIAEDKTPTNPFTGCPLAPTALKEDATLKEQIGDFVASATTPHSVSSP